MSQDIDRPRGILTSTDKAVLLNEREYDHRQQYSNRYSDIRERIANGLLDFNIIPYTLRDRDRKRIFRDLGDEAGTVDSPLTESIHELLYWTYFGLKEQGFDFETIASEAIEQAEEDFARKYWRERVDVDVRFNVDIARSDDINDIAATIENGGPINANRIYNLLGTSGAIPIDSSKLDTVYVQFDTPYLEQEMSVIESVFSDYLGVDVNIQKVQAWADPVGGELNSTITDSDRSDPDPSKIKNYRSPTDRIVENAIGDDHQQNVEQEIPDEQEHDNDIDESIADAFLNEQLEQSESAPTIRELAAEDNSIDTQDKSVTPQAVLELMDRIRDRFVSTVEIAAALQCAPDAARYALSKLITESQMQRSTVTDNEGNLLTIWYLPDE